MNAQGGAHSSAHLVYPHIDNPHGLVPEAIAKLEVKVKKSVSFQAEPETAVKGEERSRGSENKKGKTKLQRRQDALRE